MTKQLIINGIDWLDPRMIGLKCWFWNNYPKESSVDVLVKVGNNAIGTPLFFTENNKDTYYSCRLAQGDKTPYDGKGQPVPAPDGVEVKVWRDYFGKKLLTEIKLSQDVMWSQGSITHYQVQEQKVEKKYDYQDFCRDVKEIGGESTTRIPQSTVDELILRLDSCSNGLIYYRDLLPEVVSNADNEMFATIDKLLKELRRL